MESDVNLAKASKHIPTVDIDKDVLCDSPSNVNISTKRKQDIIVNIDVPNNAKLMKKNLICLGCNKEFGSLPRHFRGKAGENCKQKYSEEELQLMSRKTYQKTYQKDYNKVYQKENKEKLDTYQKDYKKENKEKLGTYQKTYQKQYYENVTKEKRKHLSLQNSLKLFKREILWGAIYPCLCCHRTLFRQGVSVAKIKELQTFSIYQEAVDLTFLSSGSGFLVKEKFWICHNCLAKIKKNILPNMSSMNALQIPHRPACLNLTEVENVLISPRINFMKMIKLPVSRMKGLKDKIINIPIPLDVIKQTIQSLPRTLEEAEVVPILLKRQKKDG